MPPFITTNINLLPALLLAFAAGTVGVFALMRRMTLASDAISHIALPGLGLALLFKINFLIGGAATLLLGVILVWALERRTKIPTETIVGVIFSISLAIGSLVTPQEDLIEALFGGFGGFSTIEFFASIILTLGIIVLILKLKNKLILEMISSDLAKVTGIKSGRLSLYFLLLFGLTVILGLKLTGALLMGSLIIIPAASAKNLAWNINSMIFWAVGLAGLSVIAGSYLADYFNFSHGPAIISLAGLIFFISLLFRKD